jgi:hypothetical protein
VSSWARARGVPPMLAALVLLVLTACAGGGGTSAVTLEELVAEQERFDGERVIVEGVLREYDDPRHYWIEDAVPNRVELEPHDAVEDLVGRELRVVGEFSYRDDRGRVITVEEVEVLGEAPRAVTS